MFALSRRTCTSEICRSSARRAGIPANAGSSAQGTGLRRNGSVDPSGSRRPFERPRGYVLVLTWLHEANSKVTCRLQAVMPTAQRLEIARTGHSDGKWSAMVEVTSSHRGGAAGKDAHALSRPHKGGQAQRMRYGMTCDTESVAHHR